MNVKRSNLITILACAVLALSLGAILACAVLALPLGACTWTSRIGKLRTDAHSIDLGDAKSVTVDLKMGAGELTIGGGADALVEADFTYNVAAWKPVVDYSVSGERGKLSIQQPEVQNWGVGSYRYEWDLRFNDGVPMDLNVVLGAGKSLLDMRHLSLTRLDLKMGVGDIELDLRGEREQDLDVTIRGGVGEATVRLPKDVGVRIKATGGLGEVNAESLRRDGDVYVNEAYGESSATITLDIEGGVGEINLEVQG